MIDICGVSKHFGTTRALNNFTLQAGAGEITGLVGPDGAGKTTLIRMICGLIDPEGGQIVLHQADAGDSGPNSIGYMPQHFSLYEDLTVSENIHFFASLYGLEKNLIDQRADEILGVTGLINFKNRLAANLSGGMKQKLSLTCSLITRPRLLILDEPTYGVDPESRKEFWQILYHLNQDGLTLFVSTPYMDEAELCHKVAMINQGELIVCDSPRGLRERFFHRVLEVRVTLQNPYFFDHVPGVIDSSYYSSRYHLLVDDTLKRQEELIDYLAASGISGAVIKEITPGMEDVFAFLAEPRTLKQPLDPSDGKPGR